MFLDVCMEDGSALIQQRSNAREGIFCFWTVVREDVPRAPYDSSNAREGIFCFWTHAWALPSSSPFKVLMPARAFFVFGQKGKLAQKWAKKKF